MKEIDIDEEDRIDEDDILIDTIDKAKDVNVSRDIIKKKIKEIKGTTKVHKKKIKNICRLKDPMLIVAPQDEGEPPSWVPAWHGEDVVWVDRDLFEKLKKRRNRKPCNICPIEINKKCKCEKRGESTKE